MTTIKEAVHDQFAAAAELYRVSAVHARGADLAQIAELVRGRGMPYVLDIGCGAGHVSAAVAPYSSNVVAADLTPAMLEQVRRLAVERGLTNITTQQADVEQLPFETASFDLVVSRYSAHHWLRPAIAIRECLRVLKPGGILLISDIVAAEEPAFDTFLQTIEYLRDRSHVRDLRVSEWLALFSSVGASAHVHSSWDLPLDFADWVKRMATPEPQVAMLRFLMDTVPADVQTKFAINATHFTIQGALFVAEHAKG